MGQRALCVYPCTFSKRFCSRLCKGCHPKLSKKTLETNWYIAFQLENCSFSFPLDPSILPNQGPSAVVSWALLSLRMWDFQLLMFWILLFENVLGLYELWSSAPFQRSSAILMLSLWSLSLFLLWLSAYRLLSIMTAWNFLSAAHFW